MLFSRGSRARHGICFSPQVWVRRVRRPRLSSRSGPGLQSEQGPTRVVRWVVDFPGWCPAIAVRGWRWSGFLPCSGPDSQHRPCREPTAASCPGRGLLRGGGASRRVIAKSGAPLSFPAQQHCSFLRVPPTPAGRSARAEAGRLPSRDGTSPALSVKAAAVLFLHTFPSAISES